MGLFSEFLRRAFLPGILARDSRQSALPHWQEIMESQYWSEQQLLDLQWQKLQTLLRHAYENCPYYTEVFRERGLTPCSFKSREDLTQLPFLTRDIVFDRKDDLFSRLYPRRELLRSVTGGTTGQQAELWISQESYNIKQAVAWRNETWMGRNPCDKIASLWPAHIDFQPHRAWKSRIKERYFLREIMYYTGYSTGDILDKAHRHLRKFNPNFFKTFPSALMVYTDYLERNGHPVPCPQAIMSTGEVLFPRQRKRFEEVFNSQVFDMYGTREVGNIASECNQHEGRHVALESIVMEIVQDGTPVAPGQEGEIIVTDLTNLSFPLIRYQINDRGRLLGHSCNCNRALPLMGPAVGRIQDDIVMRDGSRQSGLMLAVHLTAGLGDRIGEIQVIQKSVSCFHIRITNKPQPGEDLLSFIRHRMHEMMKDKITVEIEVVEEIPQENSGKTRFFICQVEQST